MNALYYFDTDLYFLRRLFSLSGIRSCFRANISKIPQKKEVVTDGSA